MAAVRKRTTASFRLCHKLCRHCGLDFTTKSPLAIWCGNRCYQRNKNGLPRPTCKRCGDDILAVAPTGKFKKYCSDECRHKGRLCRLSPDGDGICIVCCRSMFVVQAGQLYCGARCNLWAQVNPGKTRHIATECLVCSSPIIRRKSNAIYCSETCVSAVSRERRRARLKVVLYEPINRTLLGNRDGWICQLCNEPIDRNIDWPDPMAPSLDHIVPISLGGPHLFGNAQMTHLRCNLSKYNNKGKS